MQNPTRQNNKTKPEQQMTPTPTTGAQQGSPATPVPQQGQTDKPKPQQTSTPVIRDWAAI